MRVKKAGGKVYGADLTAAERKARYTMQKNNRNKTPLANPADEDFGTICICA